MGEVQVKTIIAGSRTITNFDLLISVCAKFEITLEHEITEVVCGLAKGVDTLGEKFAKNNKLAIKYFKPDWKTFGKSAGPKRNKQMVDYAEAAIILWDGFSRGTKSTIDLCIKRGIATLIYNQSKQLFEWYPPKLQDNL